MNNFKIGGKVKTIKGCRIKGTFDTLEIIELNKKWASYPAVVCKKEDGSKRLFLVKNLILI